MVISSFSFSFMVAIAYACFIFIARGLPKRITA
jgi:hypothetical protein